MAGIEFPETWEGDAPFCLLVVQEEGVTVQDLEEPGWIAAHRDIFENPGTWYLCYKENRSIAFGMKVLMGETPFVKSRVIGAMSGPLEGHVRVWGMGAKRRDGHTDSMWVLPSGLVCVGDDVELFAREQMVIG